MGISDLLTLLKTAGLREQRAANPAAISQVETAFAVTFPDDFAELWKHSDGLNGDQITFISLSKMIEYADIFESPLGLVPFTDTNDSNPHCFCCRGPLRGMIVHVSHDDEPQLVCRDLRRFVEKICDARRGNASQIVGDFDVARPDRTPEDAVLARELVQFTLAAAVDDDSRRDALLFAIQLFGAGQESELASLVHLGDEYTRDAVLRRWNGIGTKEAAEQIARDKAEYFQFLADFKREAEAAGFRTELTSRGEFRLQPGRIDPNFAMLFADLGRGGTMKKWIDRFKSRIAE